MSIYARKLSIATALFLFLGSQPSYATWLKVESENFVLFSEAKEDRTLEFLNELERYRAFLIRNGGVRPNLGGLKLSIYFTESHSRYSALTGSRGSLGIFKLTENGPITVFFQPKPPSKLVQQRRGPHQNEERQVLFHEYVHFLQFQAVPTQYPLWYREGFAEYLSSVVFREKDTIVGKVLYGRARTLHRFDWLETKVLLEAKKFPKKGYTFYAQSWLLSHMLYTLPRYRDNISAFLNLLAENVEPAVALQQAYGIDYAQLDKDIKQYFKNGQLYAFPYPPVKVTLQILSQETLSKVEGTLVDKKIRLAFSRSPRVYKAIADSIKKQLKKRPKNIELGQALTEALMGQKKWGAAQKVANDLLTQMPELHTTRALLGESILLQTFDQQTKRKTELPNEAKLIEARRHLSAAIAVMPRNARARKSYAGSFIYGGLSDFDSAEHAISEAYALYPQDWQIRRQYADLLFHRGDQTNACKLYRPLYHTAGSEDEKKRLKARLKEMENCEL